MLLQETANMGRGGSTVRGSLCAFCTCLGRAGWTALPRTADSLGPVLAVPVWPSGMADCGARRVPGKSTCQGRLAKREAFALLGQTLPSLGLPLLKSYIAIEASVAFIRSTFIHCRRCAGSGLCACSSPFYFVSFSAVTANKSSNHMFITSVARARCDALFCISAFVACFAFGIFGALHVCCLPSLHLVAVFMKITNAVRPPSNCSTHAAPGLISVGCVWMLVCLSTRSC